MEGKRVLGIGVESLFVSLLSGTILPVCILRGSGVSNLEKIIRNDVTELASNSAIVEEFSYELFFSFGTPNLWIKLVCDFIY